MTVLRASGDEARISTFFIAKAGLDVAVEVHEEAEKNPAWTRFELFGNAIAKGSGIHSRSGSRRRRCRGSESRGRRVLT